MKFEYDKLNVFCEISNIGSGNASTSLSKMLGEIVDIGLPNSDIDKILDIENKYDSPNDLVLRTILQLSGDIKGFIMIVMKVDSAINLLSKLSKEDIKCDKNDYEAIKKEISSIGEVCNILCGTYLTAISDMANLTINPSVPELSINEAKSIMNLPILLKSNTLNSIHCIETDFFTLDKKVEGKYYFIPEIDSCKKLLSSFDLDN